MWDSLVSLIPEQQLLAWYLEMVVVNDDMQALVDRIKQPDTEHIRDKLHQCEPYLNYRYQAYLQIQEKLSDFI